MAQHVVDILELVEIETQNRALIATAPVPRDLIHTFAHHHAIGQIRKRVMPCKMADMTFRPVGIGPISDSFEKTAAFHRVARNLNAAVIVPFLFDRSLTHGRGPRMLAFKPCSRRSGEPGQLQALVKQVGDAAKEPTA